MPNSAAGSSRRLHPGGSRAVPPGLSGDNLRRGPSLAAAAAVPAGPRRAAWAGGRVDSGVVRGSGKPAGVRRAGGPPTAAALLVVPWSRAC